MTLLEDLCSAQATQISSLTAENVIFKSENAAAKAEIETLRTNYGAIAQRIAEIEAFLAAQAQADLVRAQLDKDRDAAFVSLKDRSHTLRSNIKAMRDLIRQGAHNEVVATSVADVTRRMGDLEAAWARVPPGSSPAAQSGDQSHANIISRMREQICYLGRWIQHLCEQHWDSEHFTRRHSLHVVSSSFYPTSYIHIQENLASC